MALKIRSRSLKSYQLFPSSKQCINASFVKIHQLVQKIMHGKESGQRRDPHQTLQIYLTIFTVAYVYFIPITSVPATSTTDLHQLYSMLHVHLSPHPLDSCFKNNKPPPILFIVACSFESPSPRFLLQVQQTTISSIQCYLAF